MLTVKAAKLVPATPHVRTADYLQSITLRYWLVSSTAKGRLPNQKTNVGACIDACKALKQSLGPTRPLLNSVTAFSDSIVSGKPKKRSSLATISILPRSA